MQLCVNV